MSLEEGSREVDRMSPGVLGGGGSDEGVQMREFY